MEQYSITLPSVEVLPPNKKKIFHDLLKEYRLAPSQSYFSAQWFSPNLWLLCKVIIPPQLCSDSSPCQAAQQAYEVHETEQEDPYDEG